MSAGPRRIGLIAAALVVVSVGIGARMLQQPASSVAAAHVTTTVAPPLELPRAIGPGTLGLADFKGKPVYLNFFASWCPPCNMEAPDLATLARHYAPRGLVMLGVDEQESAVQALGFRNRYSLPYQIVLDADGAAGKPYGASALPVQALIDRSGNLAWLHVGMVDPGEARTAIEHALAQPAPR